jgi:glycosyltransferase involved in cell wall biosynthesis
LQQFADPQKESINLYLNKADRHFFSADSKFLCQHLIHKFWMPNTSSYQIWHSTHQLSPYFPRHSKIKIVLTIHDLNFLYDTHKSWSKKKSILQKIQSRIDHADAIVCISQFTFTEVQAHLQLRNKPCRVIHNGCNIELLPTLNRPANAPTSPFLYTVGTIAEKKNFHVLPSLLVNNDWQLVVSGITQSTTYYDKIIATAKQQGVADRLILTGPVSENDKQWYMKHCEAFVFPSIAEGFGLPVIEAMYFGKPVILSTHTALPEIGGAQAYYFDSFDPSSMQEVLQKSLKHFTEKDNHDDIVARANQFSWKNAALQYLDVYRTLY